MAHSSTSRARRVLTRSLYANALIAVGCRTVNPFQDGSGVLGDTVPTPAPLASVVAIGSDDFPLTCAGVLIAPTVVVTTASCVTEYGSGTAVPVTSPLEARVPRFVAPESADGAYERFAFAGDDARAVKAIYVHPTYVNDGKLGIKIVDDRQPITDVLDWSKRWQPTRPLDDIAVVVLAAPVPAGVSPAQLATVSPESGVQGTAAQVGWIDEERPTASRTDHVATIKGLIDQKMSLWSVVADEDFARINGSPILVDGGSGPAVVGLSAWNNLPALGDFEPIVAVDVAAHRRWILCESGAFKSEPEKQFAQARDCQ